ncbi:unnamed protein product [Ectocarpus sp. CCAP 1310/34]|nr:unnamed protein product [Ectocarpus sp. CCAP 1310/34]
MRSLPAEMASMTTRRYHSAISARKTPALTRALTITAVATGGAGGTMLTLSANLTPPCAAATTPANLPERRDSQRHGDSSSSAMMWDYLRSRLTKTLRGLLWSSLEMLLLWSPVVVSGAVVGMLCQLPLVPEETSSRFSMLWWTFLLKALARSGPTFVSRVSFFFMKPRVENAEMFRPSRMYLRRTGFRHRETVRVLFSAVMVGDGELAGSVVIERASEHRCTDPEAFCKGVNEAIQRARLGEAQAEEMLARIFRLCLKYEVRLEPRVALEVIAVAALEGLRRTLAPDCNLPTASLPSVLTAVPMKTAGAG